MTEIKITPERLEQVAKTVKDARHQIDIIHKDLYNQIEYLSFQWAGASSQKFYQDFNEAKPKAFVIVNEMNKVEEELMKAAEKFRNADDNYDGSQGNQESSSEDIEEGAMCGKLPPKSDLEKAWDDFTTGLGDAWNGLYDGAGQAIEDAVEGFKSLDDTVTKENMKYAMGHPIETFSNAWNTFSDSFMNDVWNGNIESGFHWGAYFLTSVATGFLGGKGLDKATKLARGVNFSKVTEISPPRMQPAFAGGGLTGGGILSTLPPSGHWGNYLSDYFMFARPSWRQSEVDALKDYKGYKEQVIFKDGEELKKKEKGSSIPDLYSETAKHAVEVKNYDVSTSAKRTRLAYVIGKQVEARLNNLPEGTKQSVRVDIRGQDIEPDEILDLVQKIKEKTNDKVTIEIKD
ncbi:WXG100 family type VII secretion target [Bacillus cytotoxicus]|uniref:WXG100 family type VII secretion target n=1 Tax=Bacillus cereus group sp. BfR-BA-01492 TaxID=2920361 RepID=UPI001F5AA6C7|nr:WXG100 family type VII secretion target [Bacillus cereus group sp. BfR-BA-01492]EMA6342830.1 WXG100 family type VII secretion target [Bacillus cytotoxicus]